MKRPVERASSSSDPRLGPWLASVRIHVPLRGLVVVLCVISIGGVVGGDIGAIFAGVALDRVAA